MAQAIITVQGGSDSLPTLLGQAPARIPTGGKIRPGIMVLTRKAAEQPEAKAIYTQGVAEGRSFEAIEKALAQALPQLKSPLVPRNVPWFTVRGADFPNPEIAREILDTYGEDRGQGHRLYRFPVVFPSDHWQTVMPHELAAWSTHEKRFWSQYSPDGLVRHCMHHAPVPVDHTGRRTIRIFGGRKTMQREENGGICNPESCPEYQAHQCNLTGRFLFFIPGIRSISALELPTTSFYAMSAAIQRFQAIAQMRGGRISGFLGRDRTTFFLTKVLKEVPRIDEQGRAVRVPQWIIELEAPVDVTALLTRPRRRGGDRPASPSGDPDPGRCCSGRARSWRGAGTSRGVRRRRFGEGGAVPGTPDVGAGAGARARHRPAGGALPGLCGSPMGPWLAGQPAWQGPGLG